MKIDLNQKVRVTLTARGARLLDIRDTTFAYQMPAHVSMRKEILERLRRSPRKEGHVHVTQLWDLMNDFGEHLTPGALVPFHSIESVDEQDEYAKAMKRRMYRVH